MQRKNFNKPVQFKHKYLEMLESTCNFCLDPNNVSTTDLVPDFKSNVLKVDVDVKAIRDILGPRLFITYGSQKQYLRKELSMAVFAVTNPVAAWAFGEKNFDLESQMSKSISTYMRLKPANLISFSQTVIDVVDPLLLSITGTGVNQQSLDSISDARTAFIPWANKPVNERNSEKTETQEIIRLLTDGMNITIGQLDRLAVQFKELDKINFLNGYKNRRKLKNYGAKHAHASVDVFMGDSLPVKAKVQVEGTDLYKNTDSKGHASVSPVTPGSHRLIITAEGLPEPFITEAKDFVKGKPTYFTINLQGIFNIPAPQENKQKATA
jgi:hypothetical protein